MKHLEKDMEKSTQSKTASAHQQQILFADNEMENEQSAPHVKGTADGKQILFNNQDYLPMDERDELPASVEEIELSVNESPIGRRPRWLWRIALSLFMVIISVETVDFFITGFTHSPILTSIYGVLLTCLLVISSSALMREWSTLRQFKRRQRLKQQSLLWLKSSREEALQCTATTIDVKDFCQQINKSLPCDLLSEQEQAWQRALAAEHSSDELLQLYSRVVLSKVDEKAMAEVAKFSTEAIALVSLSPVALVDMLLMLWRNLRMINKVAGLYGLKLGYWSRIKLIRQVFVNMVYAGASELITDFGTDMIGADLLGKLSGRLAQGLGAGMLTARLGVKTMQLCRPIPFNDKPKLSHVRKEMLVTIKKLLSHKNN
ncbi:MAG: TIGR01620 family protein [Litorilituus sp.]|jgi:putative membrane protein|nr:TIGR01620 family protein [Litorilituus sp.]